MEHTKEQKEKIASLKAQLGDLGVNVEGKDDESDDTSKVTPSDVYLKVVNEVTTSMKESREATVNLTKMMGDLKEANKTNRTVSSTTPFRHPMVFKDGNLNDVLAMPKTDEDLFEEMRRLNDACVSAKLYYSGVAAGTVKGGDGAQAFDMKQLQSYKDLQTLRQKAAGDFWHTGSGTEEGAEWVPTGYATSVVPVYRLARNVAALFQNVPMPNRSGVFRIPVKTSRGSWDVIAESDGSSYTFPFGGGSVVNAGTAFLALTAVKHKGISGLSREEEEDAVVMVMQIAREELALSALDTLESAIINGQATAGDSNFDDTNSPAPADGAYNGLRFFSVVTATNTVNAGGDALTLADFEAARVAQLPFSVRPGENAFITTPRGYLDLMTEASSPIRTVDLIGNAATILDGQLASIEGNPVLVSEEIPDQAADGTMDGVGGFGCSILCNYGRWRRGTKRAIEIREIEVIGDDAMVLVGFMRTALMHAKPDADDHTVVVRNHL